MDSLRLHGLVGGGGIKRNRKNSIGKYSITTTYNALLEKDNLTYNTNHAVHTSYSKTANEIFILDATRKINVYDADTYVLKRVLTLTNSIDTNIRINSASLFYNMFTSDDGRLYIHGYYQSNYAVIYEIDINNGSIISFKKSSNSTTSGHGEYSTIIDDEIYMMYASGYIDVFNLDLTLLKRRYTYRSTQLNNNNKSYIRKDKDLVVFSQSSSGNADVRNLSDGTFLFNVSTGSNKLGTTFISDNYIVVVTMYYDINIYDLSGSLLTTLSPKDEEGYSVISGIAGKIISVDGLDTIIFASYSSKKRLISLNLNNTEAIRYTDFGLSGDSYNNNNSASSSKIDDYRYVIPWFEGYGVYETYETVI